MEGREEGEGCGRQQLSPITGIGSMITWQPCTGGRRQQLQCGSKVKQFEMAFAKAYS